MLDTHARKYVEPLITRTAKLLLYWKLTANQVTVVAFLIGCSSGVFIYLGQPVLAVIVLWLSGFLDAVDGSMARLTKTSEFGTVLDVSFDRIVEISVIIGLALKFPQITFPLLLLSVAIIFSITVFLTVGAVADKQGIKSFYYQAGVAERTEGFIMFSLIILIPAVMSFLTLVYAALVAFTGVQRLLEAKRILS